MKLRSYWWVSVPVLLLVVVAVTLWVYRPAAQSNSSTPVQPVAASSPRQEPETPQVADPAEGATDEQPAQSMFECLSDLPRFLIGVVELAERGITLSMGAASGDASVRIRRPCAAFPLPQVIALTPNGAEPLSGDLTRAESKLEWGCEEPLPAVDLTAPRPVEKGDLPVALGAQAAEFLQWIPAKPVDGAIACAPPRPGFARQQQQLFELPGREGRWSLEFWERMESQAPPDSRDESVIRIFRLSRVAADGTCSLSAMTQQDSDGQYINGWPPLRKAFGLLSLPGGEPSDQPQADKPTSEKAWMIFESPRYKGSGVSAIPLAADGLLRLMETDWVVYSGC